MLRAKVSTIFLRNFILCRGSRDKIKNPGTVVKKTTPKTSRRIGIFKNILRSVAISKQNKVKINLFASLLLIFFIISVIMGLLLFSKFLVFCF